MGVDAARTGLEEGGVRRSRRRAETARQATELEALRPFLELAREIQRDVARAVEAWVTNGVG